MADVRLAWMPATELAAMIRRKKVSPVEVVDAVLDRIEKLNPRLNAFVTVTDAAARREAKAAERALGKRGARLGPLHGVPFSVKDLVNTKGGPRSARRSTATTCRPRTRRWSSV